MSSYKRQAFSIAYCGIITALAVITMFLSLVPSFAYAVPALAGIVIWTVSQHISAKWAYLCYAACGFISFMLVPEPEADLFYIFFFGYFPTLCDQLDKIKSKAVKFIMQLAIFNAAVVIAFNLTVLLMSAEEALEGMEDFGEYAVYFFWGFGNIAFLIYLFSLNYIKEAYIKVIKPRINAKLR